MTTKVGNLKIDIRIRMTIWSHILWWMLRVLVNLNLLSYEDAAAYFRKEAEFKCKIGKKGKWFIVKGHSEERAKSAIP